MINKKRRPPLTVIFDLREILFQKRGWERYGINLLRELIRSNKIKASYITENAKLARKAYPFLFTAAARVFEMKINPLPRKGLPTKGFIEEHDIYHSLTDYPEFIPRRAKLITSVHDLSFELPTEYQQKGFSRLMRDNLLTVTRHTSAVICFSRTTKKLFSAFAKKNNVKTPFPVTVIPHGTDHLCRGTNSLPAKLGNTGLPYFLYTGALDKDKNINRMILGFLKAAQNRELRLVLAGPKKRGSGIRKNLLNHEKIQYLGYVSDSELNELYTAAECFITASLDEGFGLCPLEAMSCGTPVICSDIGCFRETLRDCALFFNPYDTDDIADKIRLFLRAPLKQRDRIIADNPAEIYSWRDSAKQTLELYRSIF